MKTARLDCPSCPEVLWFRVSSVSRRSSPRSPRPLVNCLIWIILHRLTSGQLFRCNGGGSGTLTAPPVVLGLSPFTLKSDYWTGSAAD